MIFKILYILSIMYFWLSFFAVCSTADREVKAKVRPLQDFTEYITGKKVKFHNSIPERLLAYFKIIIYSLFPILNIVLGCTFNNADYKTKLIDKSVEVYKTKFSNWLKENHCEEEFVYYSQQ